jgi:hypothetical protein
MKVKRESSLSTKEMLCVEKKKKNQTDPAETGN